MLGLNTRLASRLERTSQAYVLERLEHGPPKFGLFPVHSTARNRIILYFSNNNVFQTFLLRIYATGLPR